MGIVRKSQKGWALNLDPKGVKKGAPCDPGPKDPPRTLIGLNIFFCLLMKFHTDLTLLGLGVPINDKAFTPKIKVFAYLFYRPKIIYEYI